MNQPASTLMVAVADRVVCVKISGRANFTNSLDLKKVVYELWERGYQNFILDLSDCTLMDSTFLGVLAGIGLKFYAGNGASSEGSVRIFNPNPRIKDTLENLGVLHLFPMCDVSMLPAEPFQPVTGDGEQPTRTEVTRTCLEAHQVLMALNPDNVRKFKDVTQFLAEDLKKLEGEESKVG
ncbi:MAG: STAS domain-containing protein [Verrucomicrobia bacterium]|nr:STAS domain-containing protein [Verrucomicrobiota bacterium]